MLLLAVGACFGIGVLSAQVDASHPRASTGAELFQQKGCTHCHGANGQGTERGPAVMKMHVRRSKVEEQIRNGGKSMPAFGDMLSEDEMHALVQYLAPKRHWIF